MIVDVALSPASLTDISSHKAGQFARSVQRLLIERLRSHGALVWSSKDEQTAMLELILRGDQLTQLEKKEWSEVLIWLKAGGRLKVSAQPRRLGLDSLTSWSQAVEASFAERPLVAVLSDEVYATLFPNSIDGLTSKAHDLDVSTGAQAGFAQQFVNAQHLADSEAYAAGTRREAVWRELFAPLATRSKQVTIFDRYVFAELARRQNSGGAVPEHLEWLLAKLNAHAPNGTVVKVYGSTGFCSGGTTVPTSPSDIGLTLMRRWHPRPGALARVELRTLRGVQSFPHDRHITFGSISGLELPSGLDRLARADLSNTFSFAYKWREPQIQALRDRELDVENRRPDVTEVYTRL